MCCRTDADAQKGQKESKRDYMRDSFFRTLISLSLKILVVEDDDDDERDDDDEEVKEEDFFFFSLFSKLLKLLLLRFVLCDEN